MESDNNEPQRTLYARHDSASSLVGDSQTAMSTLTVTNIPAPHIGSIKIISLNRPQAKNAISGQLLSELSSLITPLITSHPTTTRVLLLTSATPSIFCAGADLRERLLMTPSQTSTFISSLNSTFNILSSLPIPTIALVPGLALGGGLELALACTLRIFSTSTSVALPETRLGILPGAGGTWRLPLLVGPSRAADLILTGRRVGAEEALKIGLCERVVPDAELWDAGLEMAREIARGGPLAIRAAVKAMRVPGEGSETEAYEEVVVTRDRDEALRAFGEKRAAEFVGE